MEFEDSYFEIQPWPEDYEKMETCPRPDCEGPTRSLYWERVCYDDGDDVKWRVQLQCGECLTFYEGVFGEAEVDEYDLVVDRQLLKMKSDLKKETLHSMSRVTENFITALQADLILPEDF